MSHGRYPKGAPIDRLPYEPYARRVGENQKEVARNAALPLRTVVRWAKDGIPRERADQLAVALGAHPSEIWSNWFSEERAV